MDAGADTSEEHSGEGPGEQSGEDRWLTYDELGRARGIGRESAVKLVQRKRWRRVPGNDGVARILVPLDWLTPAKEPSGEHSPPRPGEPELGVVSALQVTFDTALDAIREAHAGEVTAFRGQIDELAARAKRAEQARDAAIAQTDTLHGQLAEQQVAADQARARAHALHGEVEAARIAQAEAEAAADQARHHAQEAEQAAEALRQADAARKVRGRLRRVWAAWRRE